MHFAPDEFGVTADQIDRWIAVTLCLATEPAAMARAATTAMLGARRPLCALKKF